LYSEKFSFLYKGAVDNQLPTEKIRFNSL